MLAVDGTDHVRASSAILRTKRILSQKRRFTAADTNNYETYTIQESFSYVSSGRGIEKKIRRDVYEVSSLAVEASVYLHYLYTKLLHSNDYKEAFHTKCT